MNLTIRFTEELVVLLSPKIIRVWNQYFCYWLSISPIFFTGKPLQSLSDFLSEGNGKPLQSLSDSLSDSLSEVSGALAFPGDNYYR